MKASDKIYASWATYMANVNTQAGSEYRLAKMRRLKAQLTNDRYRLTGSKASVVVPTVKPFSYYLSRAHKDMRERYTLVTRLTPEMIAHNRAIQEQTEKEGAYYNALAFTND